MTMTIKNDNERKRALIFQERKTKVHISKEDGRFHNGLILEVGSDFFIILDHENSIEEMILFSELKKPISVFKEVGK